MIVKCKQCDSFFSTIPERIKQGKGKFCSKSCYTHWQEENTNGDKNPSWKGGGVLVKCEICGKGFRIKPAIHKEGSRKCCSVKCKSEWISLNYRGDKRYNWTGEWPTVLKIRALRKYRIWRDTIFNRDRFTCKKCGAKGVYLEAHHLNSFRSLIEELKSLSLGKDLLLVAENYAPLWEIKNGITLCRKCHKDTHRRQYV